MAEHQILMLSGTTITESPATVDDASGLISVTTLTPVNADHLTTKDYVDGQFSGVPTNADLTALLGGKADLADFTPLQTAVAAKAEQVDVAALQASDTSQDALIAAKADQTEIARIEGAYVPNSQLASVGGIASANMVPRLDASGFLPADMLQGPMTAGGVLDFVSGSPPGSAAAGTLYLSSTAGTVAAAFAGLGGSTIAAGDAVYYSGTDWAKTAAPAVSIDMDQGTYTAGMVPTTATFQAMRSTTSGVRPPASVAGQLYLNLADGVLGYVDSTGKAIDAAGPGYVLPLAGGTLTGPLEAQDVEIEGGKHLALRAPTSNKVGGAVEQTDATTGLIPAEADFSALRQADGLRYTLANHKWFIGGDSDVANTGKRLMTQSEMDTRYASISSRRYKRGVKRKHGHDATDIIQQLAPKGWVWGGRLPQDDERYDQPGFGLIVEDVEKVFPHGVTRQWNHDVSPPEKRSNGLDPLALIGLLVEEVGKLRRELETTKQSLLRAGIK